MYAVIPVLPQGRFFVQEESAGKSEWWATLSMRREQVVYGKSLTVFPGLTI